jgi:hypothetical protein
VNGVLNAQSAPGASPVASGCPFYIGGIYSPAAGSCNYAGQFFNGLIDEVSYYNRALSGGEIASIYTAGSAGKCVPPLPLNCIPPPSGLAGWWPGEGNANDIAGTNNGTLLNGASFAPGEVGSAFSFNGSNQCVQIPYSQTLVSSNYSIEAWVKPLGQVSDSINQALIFGQGYGRQLVARKGTSGVIIGFYFANSSSTFFGVVSTNQIPIGQFTHLAGTWDGTTLRLYINGVLNAQLAPSASPVDPGCPFSIGGFYNNCGGAGQFFNGLIDEVSDYNRALSDGEVQAIYLADGAGKCVPPPPPPPPPNCTPPPSGLVSWWPGEGNANDIAGTNNGTPYNGVGFAPGMVGQAFVFNGTNSYVEVPDSPALRLTNQLTIEFWVQRRSLQDEDYIINKGGDYTAGMLNYGVTITRAQYGNTLAFTFAGGARDSLAITDFNWHHCAVSARNGDADPSFYVDGVLRTVTGRVGASAINLYASTAPLYIGAQVDPASGWFYYSGALVDELSIYSRALTAAEIQAIYSAGSAGKCRSSRDATASAVLAYDFVVAANITDGGYGYTNTPTVKIIGGGGSGAQAVAVVSNGMVVAVNVLDAGYGYTNLPVIVIEPPFIAQPMMGIAAMSLLSFTNLALGTNYQFQSFLGNT